MTAILALLWLALPAEAAQAPEIRAEPDGSVVGRMVLDAARDEVIEALQDTRRVGRWSPSVVDVASAPRGRCEEVTLTLRGWFFPMIVTAERCPTDQGFSQQLVDSNVFRRWGAEWEVETTPAGTEVRYRLESEISLPVTTGFVQRKTVASMQVELQALAAAVGG
ncbi:MAG: SRPBCC family protein [Alphaproteobacteria bacterium]|nr:SRPBCC family protein [Alphaproteobacteria bacterium]